MKRTILSLALIIVSTFAFGCTCGQSYGSYFLNQVKSFDAIVEGEFYRDRETRNGYLLIDKIYKGDFPSDTIKITEGGTDCWEAFMEEPGKKFILGLNKSPYQTSPDAYSAFSCVTSVLFAIGDHVYSKTRLYNLQLSNPRIGLFSTQMKKDKLAKKIRRRL